MDTYLRNICTAANELVLLLRAYALHLRTAKRLLLRTGPKQRGKFCSGVATIALQGTGILNGVLACDPRTLSQETTHPKMTSRRRVNLTNVVKQTYA